MKDGERISQYMQNSTSNIRSVGRKAIYAFIATAWALSVDKGKVPEPTILCSLFFAILYLTVDFWYFYHSAFKYKDLLKKYFRPSTDGEMEYINKERDEKDVDKETEDLMSFGDYAVKTMAILLFLSFVSLLISLISLFTLHN